MKKMKIARIIEHDYVKLIKNERVIMEKACAGHPFLVGLEFAFKTSKNLYIGMNFEKGGDFFNLLAKRVEKQ